MSNTQVVIQRLRDSGFMTIDEGALESRQWWDVIALAGTTGGRYWECFDVIAPLMTDDEYAATLREVWVATGGLSPSDAERRILRHGRSIPTTMWMRGDDAEVFDSLPSEVVVYRGCTRGPSELRWSWSLRRSTAEHFTSPADIEPSGKRIILTGTVAKRDIIALFSGEAWQEHEVVVPGHMVQIKSKEPVE